MESSKVAAGGARKRSTAVTRTSWGNDRSSALTPRRTRRLSSEMVRALCLKGGRLTSLTAFVHVGEEAPQAFGGRFGGVGRLGFLRFRQRLDQCADLFAMGDI